MIGPTPFRDMFLIAWFELKEMVHTRRALVIIAIYLLGGLVSARVFVSVLSQMEDIAADVLATSHTAKPGTLTQQVLQSETYRKKLIEHFENPEVVEFLMDLQPIVLFFVWGSMAFLPFLIVLTASDTISQEVQDRGIRFLSFRTGRVEVVLGKYLGQTLLMVGVVLATGFVQLGVAEYTMSGFSFWEGAKGVLIFWPRLASYGVAFIGLAGLWGMNMRSASQARALAFIGLVSTWVLGRFASQWRDEIYGTAWTVIDFLVPFSHTSGLWRPDVMSVLVDASVLVGLGLLYLAVGLVVFRRKDL